MAKVKKCCAEKDPARLNKVGGQAVIEGVMMKAGSRTVTTCRKDDKSLVVYDGEFVSVRKKNKFLNIPILRGVINFVEMMILSVKTLSNSADALGIEDEESKFEKWMKKHLGIGITSVIMIIAVILGVALALTLFMLLPNLISDLLDRYLLHGRLGIWTAIVEGFVKIVIFLLYLWLVSFIPDIKRTFMYHGAEHKSIACFESGAELTPENAKNFKRFHPRCGTSFMFVMILISIVISSVISIAFPSLRNIRILWMAIKILLLPIVMGLGFEFIKFAGCHDNFFVKIVSAPGLWMQRITTNEPTDDIIEVGIAALKAALYGVEEKEETQPEVETEEQAESTAEETVESENEEAEETVAVEETPVAEEKEEDTYQKAQNIVDDLFAEILSEKKSDN